jgi:predicted transposase YbfD/YdcC
MTMKKNKYVLTNAQIACQNALDSYDKCTVIKSIRSGKTLTMLDYSAKNNYLNILWITPYLTNITGLQEEIQKWNFKLKVISTTYNSLKHYSNKIYDIIVVDECHKITEDSLEYLQTIKSKKLICMTGTYPTKQDKKDILENKLGCQIVFRYTINDAVADGNVAPYTINIVQKELDKNNNVLIETKNHKFYTSEQKSYDYLISKISREYSGKRKTMLTFNMMRLLNTLPSTVDYIKLYIKNSKDKRVLIFVATQEMAEKCSKYCYYGGKSDKYYKMFHDGTINHLVLVEKATIGVTYQNLDGCLLTTINSSNSSVLQKIFRTILFRPNYTADIQILVNKNTKQIEWIKKALEN